MEECGIANKEVSMSWVGGVCPVCGGVLGLRHSKHLWHCGSCRKLVGWAPCEEEIRAKCLEYRLGGMEELRDRRPQKESIRIGIRVTEYRPCRPRPARVDV